MVSNIFSFTVYHSFVPLGEGDEKGKITGIIRSLGALARSFGPLVACGGDIIKLFAQHLGGPNFYKRATQRGGTLNYMKGIFFPCVFLI